MTSYLHDYIFFGSVPLSSVVAIKKRGLFDFHGLFIKCRRELCSGTENEIAPSILKWLHVCSPTIWFHWASSQPKLKKPAAPMALFTYCQPGHTNSSWMWVTYSIVPWLWKKKMFEWLCKSFLCLLMLIFVVWTGETKPRERIQGSDVCLSKLVTKTLIQRWEWMKWTSQWITKKFRF